MAISVDDVYKTVLLILNKEQRGYLTPDEFNKIATQVQLEIFERYFEELNQQLRVPENDSEYGNRVKNINEKLEIFKTIEDLQNGSNPFDLPSGLYKLGTVIYKDEIELQKVQRNEFLLVNKSPLTKPTTSFPIYISEDLNKLYVYPDTIVAPKDISVSYIRKPKGVSWAYIIGTVGQFEYYTNQTGSTIYGNASVDFELHESEQSEVVLNILMYAGLVIRDPQIIQTAMNKVQQEEVIEKS